MNNLRPELQSPDFATVCAAHTRRIQLLTGQFWKGEIDTWRYRKLSRELTQQFMKELATLLNKASE